MGCDCECLHVCVHVFSFYFSVCDASISCDVVVVACLYACAGTSFAFGLQCVNIWIQSEKVECVDISFFLKYLSMFFWSVCYVCVYVFVLWVCVMGVCMCLCYGCVYVLVCICLHMYAFVWVKCLKEENELRIKLMANKSISHSE